MKTAILGAGGQLAFGLQREMADWNLIPLRHADLDICDYPKVRQVLTRYKPEIVINTAAFLQVDDCEDQVEKAFQVNAFAVRHLARVCLELDCILVHISTDYVFGGEKRAPYTEEDLPNPLNAYGVSKLAGENFVRYMCPKHFVVRSAGLYGHAGSSGKEGNFVETMIHLAEIGKPIRVVDNQFVSPSYTGDVAEKLVDLLKTDAYGLYHIANAGQCSWFKFAKKIFELSRIDVDLRSTTAEELQSEALRPSYSALSSIRLSVLGIDELPSWSESLRMYLKERQHIAD